MPVTYVTTNDFLDHFGLHTVKDLPNFKELREAGFLTDFKDEEFDIWNRKTILSLEVFW